LAQTKTIVRGSIVVKIYYVLMIDTDQMSDAFGFVLKRYRKHNNVSQEMLALEAGLDRTYISLLERGLRQPTVRTVFAIAEVLSVPPHEIVEAVELRLTENQT